MDGIALRNVESVPEFRHRPCDESARPLIEVFAFVGGDTLYLDPVFHFANSVS